MNNSELRDTTMISMVRFAIMVLMAFRDLRFLSTVFLAHFIMLISLFFLFPMLLFSNQVRFLKKPGSSNKASRLASIVCSLREGPGELVVPRCDHGDCVRVARHELNTDAGPTVRVSAGRTLCVDLDQCCVYRIWSYGAGGPSRWRGVLVPTVVLHVVGLKGNTCRAGVSDEDRYVAVRAVVERVVVQCLLRHWILHQQAAE